MRDDVVYGALRQAKELSDALNRIEGMSCSIELSLSHAIGGEPDAVTEKFSYSPSAGMSWFETSGAECRECGCDWNHACFDRQTGMGCHWAEPDLCSVCARRMDARFLLRVWGVKAVAAAGLAAVIYLLIAGSGP